ncbi:hypothetical protein B0H17DRAFT_1232461 [Mycena rosella]|uniref:Uncharacterized protein n=1 Tax=Mycena rosella TaxID=1033263 RepID=A0AAD7D616_MYCRO|nr:hypothetical protein B0H17DRAFT_1232461 [Mycena rosella]
MVRLADAVRRDGYDHHGQDGVGRCGLRGGHRGPRTSLGTILIVDDDDPELVFTGKWTRNTDFFTIGHGQPTGFPFQNATHQSSNVGDSLTFQFAGTSIGVRDLFHWSVTGSVAASFSLDGGASSQTFTSSDQAAFNDQPNFEFFNAMGLVPGNHTLIVNITNVALIIDYLLYQPTFDNIASKPNFSAAPATTSSAVATGNSGGSGPQTTSVYASPHTNVKVIAGGVVGGLVLLVLLGVGLLLWTRSRRRKAANSTQNGDLFSSKIDGASMLIVGPCDTN